ncbi:DMT family transporter, partial [Camelimonas fluminis]
QKSATKGIRCDSWRSKSALIGVAIIAVVNRTMPPLATLGLIVLSFCGVVLVVTRGDISGFLDTPQHYAANLLILLGMTSWMVYTFGAVRFTTWSPLRYTTLTMCLGAITILTINAALFATHAIAVPSLDDIFFVVPHVLYMGLVAGMAGVLCWNIGNKLLPPLNAALFLNLVPLVAFAVSALIGILPTHIQIIGACVTVSALVLNNFYHRLPVRQPDMASSQQ